jgi:hypothetical protein
MNADVAQCRALLLLAERALAGLDDTHLATEPAAGAKTAGWLVGHLAVTGDFARRLCGRTALCPAEWRAAFNPGTTPSMHAADYPRMTDLGRAMIAVYRDLCDAALHASAAALTVENPYAPKREEFPTAGEFIAYILAGHFGYHLGQLVAWRAAAGLGRLAHD